jgi:NADH-quinone oxidoreductase subunit N
MDLIPAYSSIRPFLPELCLLASVLIGLLIPVITGRHKHLPVILGILSLAGGLVVLATMMGSEQSTQTGVLFGGLLVTDPYSWMIKLIIVLTYLVCVLMWLFVTRPQQSDLDAVEFLTLLGCATLGLCLMVSTDHLLMLFIAMETASLPSYILAAFRKHERVGAEAGVKYVLFGAVCSGLMLYGISMLYALHGSLDIPTIGHHTQQILSAGYLGPNAIVCILGIVGLLIGIGFKISMVPMHFWCPDVFEGTHPDIAAFLSVASKAAGLGLLMRVVTNLINTPMTGAPADQLLTRFAPSSSMTFLLTAIVLIGVVTCFWGNLTAYRQTNIQRLLAYSSIGHAGYMLLIFGTLSSPATSMVLPAAHALLTYLLFYMLMNLGAFAVAAAVRKETGSSELASFTGLGRRAPWLAAAMVIFMLSLTGIPLTVGFMAKFKIFQILFANALGQGQILGWIGIVTLGINTVLAAFFYFRVISQMYLVDSDATPLAAWTPAMLLAVLLIIPNVLFFITYGWIDRVLLDFALLVARNG